MPSPVTNTAPGRTLPQVAAVLASLLAVSSLSAQTPAPEAAAPAKDSEVVILSPFAVTDTQTSGYQTTNSIGGTRSNTLIKDVPMNIQVLNSELAMDISALSQLDLERYNAALVNGGADVHSSNAIQQAYNGFLFRGYVQNWGIRDGIRNYDPIDMQGISRVEIIKGPAAPLYGLSYPGGVMNSISKEVDFMHNSTTIGASVQNEGEYRATVDANYVGDVGNGGKFGVRVNAARSQTEDQRSHSAGMAKFTQINLAWRPLPQTEIKFLAEDGYREKPNGLGYFSSGGAHGADTPLQIMNPQIPWSWNWADNKNMRSLDANLYRGTITQSIGENFSVTGYIQATKRKQIDSNGWDAAGGGGSGASWDAAGGTGWINIGTPQEMIRKSFHYRDWCNDQKGYGATAVYKLDTGPLKNTFTVGANAWSERFHSDKGVQPASSTNVYDFAISTSVNPSAVPLLPPNDYVMSVGSPTEDSSNDYYFASWQISALDNRLKVNAAINRTNIKDVQYNTPIKTVKDSKDSPMIGAMYDITKEISVFAVHSSSFFPTTDKNDFDEQMPPVTGKSNEAGIKVELMGGKISGTVSYYQIKQSGGDVRDNNAINVKKAAWNANVGAGRPGTDGIVMSGWPAGQIPVDRDSNSATNEYLSWDDTTTAERTAAYNSLTDRSGNLGDLVPNPGSNESRGFEADMVFQATANWQIMASYAHNTIDSRPGGHIKDQLSMLTKYTFTEGPVNGLSIGMGLQYAGKSYQGTVEGFDRFNPSDIYVETFAAYKFKAWGYDHRVQLNVKNLTKVAEQVGWYADAGETVATHRYEVPTKIIWNLSYSLTF